MWEQRFHDSPRTSQIYNSLLTSPPDGHPHMILRITSTGYRFKGQHYEHHYWLRFRHHLLPTTEEEVACECGVLLEDTEHVLLHCPLTHRHRHQLLFTQGTLDSLKEVFDHPTRCLGLLHFLETTRTCVKPRAIWEPG
ncbi:hypothetical protein BJV74DRAFT_873786 [Russula compacta]|nr:hypothetical protein BJV74DRAFT_873786 [Russula compacta]